MRDVSSRTRQIIEGGQLDAWYVADLIYDGERRLQDVPVMDVSLQWDGGAQVAGSGSVTVIWSDLFGGSMIPERIGDMFSPFGAELQIDMMIGLGQVERVPMGRFVIESVPAATRQLLDRAVGGLPVNLGERIELRLKDLFHRVQRDRFPFPQSPSTVSMWQEAQLLTGFPTIRNTPDRTIPRSVTYDEDRLNALGELFALVDAWPHLTPSGQLTARPKKWGEPVDEFRHVASAPRVMDSDRTYNRVVVEGKNPDGDAVRAVAEVTDGYLRVRNSDGTRSPFGAATYFYQSDFLTTPGQCRLVADDMLPRVSRLRSVTRDVVEPLNPVREVGDVVLLEGEPTRIKSVTHDRTTTTSVVEIADE